MKPSLVFFSLLLLGCFDLDSLSSGRCPDNHVCSSTEECIDFKCVPKTIPSGDMSTDMLGDMITNSCFTTYFPDWTPNWYPKGLPANKCMDIQINCKTKCSGQTVYLLTCNSNPRLGIYINDTSSVTIYRSFVDRTSDTTVFETVRTNGALNCTSGIDPVCTNYTYSNYWCDVIN